jgi:multidrug resistance efflux pump
MKNPLSPIPRPASERWRDIRLRHFPFLVYAAAVVMVVYLWDTQWMPSTFTGEVQATVANVTSPMDGLLVNMSVQQFDRVAKGQVVGKVTMTPEMKRAALAAIRSDLQVMRTRMIQDQQRIGQNYQQLLAERMNQQADLDSTIFDLRYVQSDLVRTQKLRSAEYIETLATQVKERAKLVDDLDRALVSMKPKDDQGAESLIVNTIDEATKAEEDRFLESSEAVLISPIDGVVTKVSRQEGENISAGETLITISGEHSDSIIGFVRQPISFEPKVGDKVVVRTRRGTQRTAAEAHILKVGARLELFTQPLRVRGFDSSQERGLPVLINAPDGLALYPGELVDLALKN